MSNHFYDLPDELKIVIFTFDKTYREIFDAVLRELRRDFWILDPDKRMPMWIPL